MLCVRRAFFIQSDTKEGRPPKEKSRLLYGISWNMAATKQKKVVPLSPSWIWKMGKVRVTASSFLLSNNSEGETVEGKSGWYDALCSSVFFPLATYREIIFFYKESFFCHHRTCRRRQRHEKVKIDCRYFTRVYEEDPPFSRLLLLRLFFPRADGHCIIQAHTGFLPKRVKKNPWISRATHFPK